MTDIKLTQIKSIFDSSEFPTPDQIDLNQYYEVEIEFETVNGTDVQVAWTFYFMKNGDDNGSETQVAYRVGKEKCESNGTEIKYTTQSELDQLRAENEGLKKQLETKQITGTAASGLIENVTNTVIPKISLQPIIDSLNRQNEQYKQLNEQLKSLIEQLKPDKITTEITSKLSEQMTQIVTQNTESITANDKIAQELGEAKQKIVDLENTITDNENKCKTELESLKQALAAAQQHIIKTGEEETHQQPESSVSQPTESLTELFTKEYINQLSNSDDNLDTKLIQPIDEWIQYYKSKGAIGAYDTNIDVTKPPIKDIIDKLKKLTKLPKSNTKIHKILTWINTFASNKSNSTQSTYEEHEKAIQKELELKPLKKQLSKLKTYTLTTIKTQSNTFFDLLQNKKTSLETDLKTKQQNLLSKQQNLLSKQQNLLSKQQHLSELNKTKTEKISKQSDISSIEKIIASTKAEISLIEKIIESTKAEISLIEKYLEFVKTQIKEYELYNKDSIEPYIEKITKITPDEIAKSKNYTEEFQTNTKTINEGNTPIIEKLKYFETQFKNKLKEFETQFNGTFPKTTSKTKRGGSSRKAKPRKSKSVTFRAYS